MASKLTETAITGEDLKSYVSEADDFRFELKVFELCRAYGDRAQHGGTYEDPVTRKDREFDIRMEVGSENHVIKLAVECKNIKEFFPLLVSRVPRRRSESYHDAIVQRHLDVRGKRYEVNNELYPQYDFVGKSTTQVGKRWNANSYNSPWETDNKEVYEKWGQAVASAYDLLVHSLPSLEEERDFRHRFRLTAILPVLVIPDGRLWAVDYKSDGSIKDAPHAVSECTLYLGKEYNASRGRWVATHKLSHLHIFTFTGFSTFLQRDRRYLFEEVFPERESNLS